MPAHTKWTTSIDELIALFSDAICALVPIAERAHMPWKEPDAYDDWDLICEAIYRSIVIRSIECAEEIGAFLPVPSYDRRINSYAENSFVSSSKSEEAMAFICFETEITPFDQCLFALLDRDLNVVGKRRVARANVKFNFRRRDRERIALEVLDHLIVSL